MPVFCFSVTQTLDEIWKINNDSDVVIQIKHNEQQWDAAWVIWVNIDRSCVLCCPDDDKTMAGNDVNGDLLKQKHCMQGVSWESGWQWIKNETRNNGADVIDNIYGFKQMLVWEKKEWGLIIWIHVLLEPRLQPTWMFQKPHQTEMGGWTLIHVRLSFSDICLH